MHYGKANPFEIDPDAWYDLTTVAKIFDCSPDTLRLAIKTGKLKARKRRRTWIVFGKHALAWWHRVVSSR